MASMVSLKYSQVKVEACPCPCRVALLNRYSIYFKDRGWQNSLQDSGYLHIVCQMSGRGSWLFTFELLSLWGKCELPLQHSMGRGARLQTSFRVTFPLKEHRLSYVASKSESWVWKGFTNPMSELFWNKSNYIQHYHQFSLLTFRGSSH
jgi:hypothetical protein